MYSMVLPKTPRVKGMRGGQIFSTSRHSRERLRFGGGDKQNWGGTVRPISLFNSSKGLSSCEIQFQKALLDLESVSAALMSEVFTDQCRSRSEATTWGAQRKGGGKV